MTGTIQWYANQCGGKEFTSSYEAQLLPSAGYFRNSPQTVAPQGHAESRPYGVDLRRQINPPYINYKLQKRFLGIFAAATFTPLDETPETTFRTSPLPLLVSKYEKMIKI